MSEPAISGFLKKVADHTYRFFARVFSDTQPRITLSRRLSFRIFPDKAVLIDLGESNCTAQLSRGALGAILDSMHLASSSGQIRTIEAEGLTIETDGRPQRPRIFDDAPLSWLWNPSTVAMASKPTIDYLPIEIKGSVGHIRDVIQKNKLELARAALAKLEASRMM